MNIKLLQKELLKPLQRVSGAIEHRQTIPILGNILVETDKNSLRLIATDLEIEIIANCSFISSEEGARFTAPARKLLEICKNLPSEAVIDISIDKNRLTLKSGKSKFYLSTLPPDDFPRLESPAAALEVILDTATLAAMIEHTSFAIAVEDVRYYLNGLYFEIKSNSITAVATDGHRLALYRSTQEIPLPQQQIAPIIPRKTVLELLKIIKDSGSELKIDFAENTIVFSSENLNLTSKLIDGRFPDYERVIPKNNKNIARVDKEELRSAIQRVSVLSNEKHKGIRMTLKQGTICLESSNPEHDEAIEEIKAEYDGLNIECGFNYAYLIDVLNACDSNEIQMAFNDSSSSVLLTDPHHPQATYVIMPMRL